MEGTLTFYLILGGLLLGFVILNLIKGVIKMLLFGAAVLVAIGTYFWLSQYGYAYVAFLTQNPQEWMVTSLSIVGALLMFFGLMHGLFWFSNVFSWGKKMGTGGAKGILTTILMVLVVCWVGVMCVFYYGSMAEMKRVQELALYHMDTSRVISQPVVYSIKQAITQNRALQWLESISPEHDPERLALAKIITYLCTLEPTLSEQRRMQLDAYMPYSRITSRVLSLKSLSQDPAIRQIVNQGDLQGLYNNAKLTGFLADPNVRQVFSQLDVDRVLGFAVLEEIPRPPSENEQIPQAIPVTE